MATIFKYFKKVSFFKKIPQIETLNWIFLSFFFMLRKKLNFVWLREIYRDKWSNFLRVRKKMFFVNSFSFFLFFFFIYIYLQAIRKLLRRYKSSNRDNFYSRWDTAMYTCNERTHLEQKRGIRVKIVISHYSIHKNFHSFKSFVFNIIIKTKLDYLTGWNNTTGGKIFLHVTINKRRIYSRNIFQNYLSRTGSKNARLKNWSTSSCILQPIPRTIFPRQIKSKMPKKQRNEKRERKEKRSRRRYQSAYRGYAITWFKFLSKDANPSFALHLEQFSLQLFPTRVLFLFSSRDKEKKKKRDEEEAGDPNWSVALNEPRPLTSVSREDVQDK